MSKQETLFSEVQSRILIENYAKRPNGFELPDDKQMVLKDEFLVVSGGQKNQYFKFSVELRNSVIVFRKLQNQAILGYMDIYNTIMLIQSGVKIKEQIYYGIKFIKNGVYEIIYTQKEDVLKMWFMHLKRFCFLIKFKLYYRQVKSLGQGNFAQVFQVQRKTDKKTFAAKIFDKRNIMTDDLEKKCLRYELNLMRQINHPKIMRTHELYEGENYIYCVIDYFEGSNLLDAIVKKGHQPEVKSLAIILQLLQALDYLHDNKIIHRDLKPDNIIFKDDETIEIGLVDLGFATYCEDYDKLFKRCGTPGYVAPEILADQPYDTQADIFSCGVVFYILQVNKINRKSPILWQKLERDREEKHRGQHQLQYSQKRKFFQDKQDNKPLAYSKECYRKIPKRDQQLNRPSTMSAFRIHFQKVH